MEKFGIFNLLSALSQLQNPRESDDTQGGNSQNAQDEPQAKAPETPSAQNQSGAAAGTGLFSAEERVARLTQVLQRHEQIARRIDKNNKT